MARRTTDWSIKEDRLLITGCSGGGKSTLLEALAARGGITVPEPGRRVVAQEMASGGLALPWINLRSFASRALAMARVDLWQHEAREKRVYFDRGVVDAAVALEHAGGRAVQKTLASGSPYAELVFVAPPWQEIYEQDDVRQHSFDEAVAEYERICDALNRLGHEVCLLPKTSVEKRVVFMVNILRAREAKKNKSPAETSGA